MKPLSPNNNQLQLTVPAILTVCGLLATIIFLKNTILWLLLGVFIITGFFVFYVLSIYNRIENVYYDTDFLYLKSKNQTRKIKLQKIKRVKLTLSDQRILGMHYHEYRIEFTNEFGMNDSITIWISGFQDYISDFEKYLDYYAPNVEIKHSATSFDA